MEKSLIYLFLIVFKKLDFKKVPENRGREKTVDGRGELAEENQRQG